MYIDLLVLAILILLVVLFTKKFSSFIYLMVIIDILLKLLAYVRFNLGVPELSSLIAQYFPTGIDGMITTYTNGIFTTILMWCLFAIYVVFEFYTIKVFWKKK